MYYSPIRQKKSMTNAQTRVGRIQYMNVAPVYYALDMFKPQDFQLTGAPPASLNRMLALGQLDISPVSSVAYGYNQDQWDLLPELSISSRGKVMSVKLVSRFQMADLNQKLIILTSESETAAALLKLLFIKKNVMPQYTTRPILSPEWIVNSDSAALIIGDAALKYPWEKLFPYVYDLGKMWQMETNLPFVFGVWAVRKQYAYEHPEQVRRLIQKFHQSKALGLENIASISRMAAHKLGIDIKTCNAYFKCLDYDLNDIHLSGLRFFFDGLGMSLKSPGKL